MSCQSGVCVERGRRRRVKAPFIEWERSVIWSVHFSPPSLFLCDTTPWIRLLSTLKIRAGSSPDSTRKTRESSRVDIDSNESSQTRSDSRFRFAMFWGSFWVQEGLKKLNYWPRNDAKHLERILRSFEALYGPYSLKFDLNFKLMCHLRLKLGALSLFWCKNPLISWLKTWDLLTRIRLDSKGCDSYSTRLEILRTRSSSTRFLFLWSRDSVQAVKD